GVDAQARAAELQYVVLFSRVDGVDDRIGKLPEFFVRVQAGQGQQHLFARLPVEFSHEYRAGGALHPVEEAADVGTGASEAEHGVVDEFHRGRAVPVDELHGFERGDEV